jgi:sugar phosphate isomerase/epimerase
MTAPIGIQLYSVRENLKVDFESTMKKIADIGFAGVETYNFSDSVSATQAKALFDDLGLTVIGSHIDLPLGENKQKVLDTMSALNSPHLVSPSVNRDYYTSKDKIRTLADTFNEAAAVAVENGLRFSIHNHEFEYAVLDGVPAIYHLKKYLDPTVYFQVDTYWVQVAGQDPIDVVINYGERAPLLHIKDGPATKEADMTALGEGIVDVPGIIKAGEPYTEWLILEIDRCATDMLEAIEKSYQYLENLSNA